MKASFTKHGLFKQGIEGPDVVKLWVAYLLGELGALLYLAEHTQDTPEHQQTHKIFVCLHNMMSGEDFANDPSVPLYTMTLCKPFSEEWHKYQQDHLSQENKAFSDSELDELAKHFQDLIKPSILPDNSIDIAFKNMEPCSSDH